MTSYNVNTVANANLVLNSTSSVEAVGIKSTLLKNNVEGPGVVLQSTIIGGSQTLIIPIPVGPINNHYDSIKIIIWELLSGPTGQYAGDILTTVILPVSIDIVGGLSVNISAESLTDNVYNIGWTYLLRGSFYPPYTDYGSYRWTYTAFSNQSTQVRSVGKLSGWVLWDETRPVPANFLQGGAIIFSVPLEVPPGNYYLTVEYYWGGFTSPMRVLPLIYQVV